LTFLRSGLQQTKKADVYKFQTKEKLEVKYHYEGDTILVHDFLQKSSSNLGSARDTLLSNKKGGPATTVLKEVLSDVMSNADYFIWHLSLRPNDPNKANLYHPRLKYFYKYSWIKTHPNEYAQEIIEKINLEIDKNSTN